MAEYPIRDLTQREKEIAQYVVEGFTNREIAGREGIGLQTVKNTVSTIYRKLQIHSRAELMARIPQK